MLAELDFSAMFDPEVTEIFRDEVWPELSRAGRWEGERPMLTVDGRRILVQQWMTAERDADGQLIRSCPPATT